LVIWQVCYYQSSFIIIQTLKNRGVSKYESSEADHHHHQEENDGKGGSS